MATATDRNRSALALSGGGFRATLYHCGAFLRLNELGLLPTIERIASVSGGSIAAGRLAVRWNNLKFNNAGQAINLEDEVIDPIRIFCRRKVDLTSVGVGGLLPILSIGDVLTRTYNKHLGLNDKTLQDIPDVPQFIFMATNLQTGRAVRLSKKRLADFRLGEIRYPDVSVATSVAASSAFPPVLSPVKIDLDINDWEDFKGTDLYKNPEFAKTLLLTDGGAYDNLGLETVDTFKTLLISDAGAPFSTQSDNQTLWHQQVLRALDIATDQARALRKRYIFDQHNVKNRRLAFWGIDQNLSRSRLKGALPCPVDVTTGLSEIRTRLNRFNDREQEQLINWGYAASDIALRSFIKQDAEPPSTWPYPRYALDR